MYICVCNNLKEKCVQSAIADGACTAAETFRKLGCQPQCGKCVPTIRESLASAQNFISEK